MRKLFFIYICLGKAVPLIKRCFSTADSDGDTNDARLHNATLNMVCGRVVHVAPPHYNHTLPGDTGDTASTRRRFPFVGAHFIKK